MPIQRNNFFAQIMFCLIKYCDLTDEMSMAISGIRCPDLQIGHLCKLCFGNRDTVSGNLTWTLAQ